MSYRGLPFGRGAVTAVTAVIVGIAVASGGGCGDDAPTTGCERTCPTGTTCQQGACVAPPCDDGLADCNGLPADGCEVVLATDGASCGACGHACAADHATTACVDGACVVSACADGFADCDHADGNGCEVDLGAVATCGACDTACASGPHGTATCGPGGCGLACENGWDDCDGDAATGCEVELATAEAHCGGCATACAATETCEAGQCTTTTAACATRPDDPVTGQRCPIDAPCTASAACGTQLGAPTFRYWYCSTTLHSCQFLPQVGGFVTAAGACTGQLQVRQLASAPYDKRIIPPDGVALRTATTIAIEVSNTTATDLYLDQLPVTLELAGTNPSRFDVSAVRLYQVGNISDYGDGNNATQLVCVSPSTPFAAASTFTLGTGATGGCGASAFSRVRAGNSTRFLVNLGFAPSATFITGRQYRLTIASPLTGVRARTMLTGASAAYTACALPAAGITGSYLTFEQP